MNQTTTFAPTAFFDAVRAPLFSGHMTEGQVSGTTVLLDAWFAGYANQDIRWLAYALATAYHETARTMQPIEEYGRGRGRAYGMPDPTTHQVYYGRGYVQLTWIGNYRKMGSLLGLDLVGHPELALVPVHAAAILYSGMTMGIFTGEKLADFFGETTNDPVYARRIINGTDCAQEIAGYYTDFLGALDVAVQLLAVPADAGLAASA
jgi:hypothetical protein